jgi:hypothetical protein
MLGFGQYADSSRLMNDDIRAFQGRVSEVQGLNKELQAQAGQKADLDTLRDIGQEFAIKQTKDLVARYGKKAFGDAVGGDTDKLLGSYVDKGLDKIFGSGVNVSTPLTSGADTLPSTTNLSVNELNTQNIYQNPVNTTEPQNVGADTGDVNIAKTSSSEIEMTESAKSSGFAGVEMDAPSGVNIAGEGAQGAGEGAGEVAGAVAGDVGADVAEVATQATAGVLASTGVLAPLGGLLEIGADLFALFEGAKTTADFVSRDILHTNAPLQYDKQIIPNAPQTLAQKGLSVNPSMDTYDLPHNTASVGW